MRGLLASTPLLALLVLPGVALAEASHPLTLDAPSFGWVGRHYGVGAWPTTEICPRTQCDLVPLVVDFSTELPPPWPPLAATVVWPDAGDDFDVALFDAWGMRVVVDTVVTPTSETIRVREVKPGDYMLAVAPRLVTESAYLGSVALEGTT